MHAFSQVQPSCSCLGRPLFVFSRQQKGTARQQQLSTHKLQVSRVATAAATTSKGSISQDNVTDCGAVKILYQPPAEQVPICDIIFFHGSNLLYNSRSWRDDWTNSQGVLWPQTWLPQDFPLARIACVSYDIAFVSGTMTLKDIGNNLLARLCSTQLRVGQGKRPVLLIGHSMGGIILKQVCCQAGEAQEHVTTVASAATPADISARAQFCDNVAGAFFFSTPHGGSAFAAVVSFVACIMSRSGPVLGMLAELSRLKEHAPLNAKFDERYKGKIELACAYETQPPGASIHSIHMFTPGALALAALTGIVVACILAVWVVPCCFPALAWSSTVAAYMPAWLTAQTAASVLMGAVVGLLADMYCYQHLLLVDRASAVLGMDEDKVCALQEDHASTARPASRSSDSYIHLQEHLQRSLHKYYQRQFAGQLTLDNLEVGLEQASCRLWLDAEFPRPSNKHRIFWQDFWHVLQQTLIDSEDELHYPEMWEFRDQQLHKLQHQRHFQRAISANSKPWVLREQLLDAVRGAGVADVINAAMNSAWTPWLPMAGDHATTGTITQAVHAPPGEVIVSWHLGRNKGGSLVALQGITDKGTQLTELSAVPASSMGDAVVEEWVAVSPAAGGEGGTAAGKRMSTLWGSTAAHSDCGSTAGLLDCTAKESGWQVDSRKQLCQVDGGVVGYQLHVGGAANQGRFRFLFRDFAAKRPAAAAMAVSIDDSKELLRPRHQAFLSHTGQDKDKGTVSLVQAVKERLQDQRIPAFFDARVLQPSAPFAPCLELGLVASKVFVVVVSPNYFSRFWCMRELDLALNAEGADRGGRGRRIVPILLGMRHGDFAADAELERFWQDWAAIVQKHPERAAAVNFERWTKNVRFLAGLQAYNAASYGAAAGDKDWETRVAETVAKLVASKMSE